MSFSPIAFIAPNYRDFKNEWLKAYSPGTTTPKPMALESNGGTQVAKLQLNADGFIVSAGDALVIPYIDGAYDLWLFPTEFDADNNITANAIRVADDITGVSGSSITADLINDLSQSYTFPTDTAYKASTILFPAGKTIHLDDRDADFKVIAGTGTGDGIIVSTTVSQSISLIVKDKVFLSSLGVLSDGSEQTAEFLEGQSLANTLKVPLDCESLIFEVNAGVPLDVGVTSLIGNGARITFNPAGDTTLLTLSNSEPDVNKRGLLAAANATKGISFFGKGKAVGNSRFCIINDAVDNSIWGVSFKDGGAFGFPRGIETVNGAFMTSLDNFHMISNGVCLNFAAGTNAGERNTILNSTLTNNDVNLTQSNPNASTDFIGSSCDYTPRMMTITGGDVKIIGGHIESDLDTQNWFVVSGANSSLRISAGTSIVLNNTAADLAFAPFFSDASCVMGGIHISNFELWTNATYTTDVLIGGDGVSTVSSATYFENSKKPALTRFDTDVAYGDIENANWANDYILSGTIPPTQSAAKAHTGTNSLEFNMLGGTQSRAIVERECKAGDFVSGHFYYQTEVAASAGGAGANFFVELRYLDQAGATISNFTRLNQTLDIVTFTLFEFAAQRRAPAGTVKYQLRMEIFGASSGPAGKAWIDDLIVNVV